MSEVSLHIDDEFIEQLQSVLGFSRATDVVREALTILNWAVEERKKGRVLLAADADGHNVTRLAIHSLEEIVG